MHKSIKFKLFGISLYIRASYPSVKSISSSASYFFINYKRRLLTLIIFPILAAVYGLTVLFNNSAYATFTSPLIQRFSPVLAIAEKNTSSPELLGNDQIIFSGPNDTKKIALTFDANMTPEMKKDLETGLVYDWYDPAITDILNLTQTKATFFLTGMWIETYLEETKEFAVNPLFELANHSYSNPSFDGDCFRLHQISDVETSAEIQKTQMLLKDVAGIDNKLFRFPGGCYSQNDLDTVEKLGIIAIQWDVLGQDGFNDDPNNIEENVLENVRPGSIILLHLNGYPNAPQTAAALPYIISTLKQNGYEFVKVSELLQIKANSDVINHISLKHLQ